MRCWLTKRIKYDSLYGKSEGKLAEKILFL